TLGVASYGVARVLRRMAGGYTLLATGLFAASFVRPHSALLALIAFMLALVLGRRTAVRQTITPGFLAKLVGVALILAPGRVLVAGTQQLLGVEDLSSSSLERVANTASRNTTEGNSAFTATNPRSITGFPKATITVLFRPFPTEASGMEQLVAAAEGIFL